MKGTPVCRVALICKCRVIKRWAEIVHVAASPWHSAGVNNCRKLRASDSARHRKGAVHMMRGEQGRRRSASLGTFAEGVRHWNSRRWRLIKGPGDGLQRPREWTIKDQGQVAIRSLHIPTRRRYASCVVFGVVGLPLSRCRSRHLPPRPRTGIMLNVSQAAAGKGTGNADSGVPPRAPTLSEVAF